MALAASVAAGASSSMKSDRQKWLPILDALREPGLGERPRNEIACAQQAPIEHRAGVPGDADVPGLDHLERDERRVEQVPQFMRKESEPLVLANGFAVDGGLIAFAPVLGDRAGDGAVEAAVQHAESLPC